jgi:hypothetical protein
MYIMLAMKVRFEQANHWSEVVYIQGVQKCFSRGGSVAVSNIMNNEFYTKWKPIKTGFKNITGPSQAENGR